MAANAPAWRLRWPWAVVALMVALLWLGWRSLSFDRVDDVAHALVLQPDGHFDLAVWAAAFAARFPEGSRVDALASFVTGFRGRCNEGPEVSTIFCGGNESDRPAACAQQVNDTLHCVLPLAGTVCIGTGLAIEAHIDAARAVQASRPAPRGHLLMARAGAGSR